MNNKVTSTKRNRRYYLHKKVRERGLSLSVKNRTIYVPWNANALPKHAEMLRNEYHYSIQTEII